MSDRWNKGEPLSAAKLNRHSASNAQTNYSGNGYMERSGNNWGIDSPSPSGVESFWVSVDREEAITYETQTSTPYTPGSPSTTTTHSRTIYRYEWTEVRFDKTFGCWVKTGTTGHMGADPLVNYDPTQRIPLTEDPVTSPFSGMPIVKGIVPVMRDPQCGQLFFFS
jgi:hypothetical protein